MNFKSHIKFEELENHYGELEDKVGVYLSLPSTHILVLSDQLDEMDEEFGETYEGEITYFVRDDTYEDLPGQHFIYLSLSDTPIAMYLKRTETIGKVKAHITMERI